MPWQYVSASSIAVGPTADCPACGQFPVGSNGQLYLLMVCNGWVGTGLFLSFFGYLAWRFRRDRTPYGMAGMLVSLGAIEDGPISPGPVARVLADEAGREAVERLLQLGKERAATLLRAHRHLVDALVDALLERDELIGEEITDVLARAAGGGVHAPSSELTDR